MPARSSNPAGRHETWRSLVGHLLFKQEVKQAKILKCDASGMAEPFAACSIAATSDLKEICKKSRKFSFFAPGT
jgi:hypothetical protein